MGENRISRIPYIDELKGVAIIFIVLTHYSQMFSTTILNKIFALGQMGCQLFFVISGLTLSASYSQKKPSFSLYINNRFKRIAIPWWCIVLLYSLFGYLSIAVVNKNVLGTNIDPLAIIINLFFLNGIIPFCNNNVVLGGWYLGTTVIFYLFFPLMHFAYYRLKNCIHTIVMIVFPLAFIFVDCIVMSIVCIMTNNGIDNNSFWYFSAINQIVCFVLGMVLFDLFYNEQLKSVRCLTLKFFTTLSTGIILFYSSLRNKSIVMPIVFGLADFYFIIIVLKNKDFFKKLFKSKFFRLLNKIGEFSFSIYLTHLFSAYYLTRVLKRLLRGTINNENVVFFIILPIGFISVYYIASFFQRITLYLEMKIYTHKKET